MGKKKKNKSLKKPALLRPKRKHFRRYSVHHIIFITLSGALIILVYTVCKVKFPGFMPYAEGLVAGGTSKVGEKLFGSAMGESEEG